MNCCKETLHCIVKAGGSLQLSIQSFDCHVTTTLMVHVEDNMVMLQCGQVMSFSSVSVFIMWLWMIHVFCFFM